MLGKLLISALFFLYMYIRAQCGTLLNRATKSLKARQKVSLLEQNGAQFVIIAVWHSERFFQLLLFQNSNLSNLKLRFELQYLRRQSQEVVEQNETQFVALKLAKQATNFPNTQKTEPQPFKPSKPRFYILSQKLSLLGGSHAQQNHAKRKSW